MAFDAGIIDCDVHPVLPNTQALLPYLSQRWRSVAGEIGEGKVSSYSPRYPKSSKDRISAAPPTGGSPASDPEFLIADLIERLNIDCALLLPFQMRQVGTWIDPDGAVAWARAFNRYFLDHWLGDSRFRMAICAAPQDPVASARLIREFGSEPGVAGIWLPWAMNVHLGRRHYRPIYEAACDVGLPVMVHGAGAEGFQGQPASAGGTWEYHAERNAALGAGDFVLNNLISLVFTDTFVRFPSLKVVFIETGFTWVGPALWRMDKAWREHRADTPWLTCSPTDVVIEHCRFTTQPMPEAEPRKFVLQAARHMHAERTLLFSTDYPHYDADENPQQLFRGWPDDLQARVFRENALETFGSLMQPVTHA